MIIVRGTARFGPGEMDRLRPELAAYLDEVRARDGCIDYCYAVDLKDADCLHVIEAWRDEAAVEAYLDDLGGLLAILAGAEMQTPQVNAYEGRFFKVIMGDGPSD
jgi:Antibiotic biosynthesis monooxygenase